MADFVDDLNLESGKASNPSSFVDDLDLTEKPKPSLWDRAKSAVGMGEEAPKREMTVNPSSVTAAPQQEPVHGPMTAAVRLIQGVRDQKSEPLLLTKDAAGSAFIRTMSRVPENLLASGVKAVKGQAGVSVVDQDLGNRLVSWVEERNKKLAQEYSDKGMISKRDVAELGPNLGFSGISMGAGILGGMGGGVAGSFLPGPGNVAGAVSGSMAASGAAAYRMQTYSAMMDWLTKVNEESIKQTGKPITPAEEKKFKEHFDKLASESGLWEAGPEAVGNVLEIALMAGKGTLPGRLASLLPKGTAGKVVKGVARAAGIVGTEEATETITQHGQHNVEVKAGMSKEPIREWTSGDDLLKSAGDVLPGVLLLSGFMTGGGAIYRKAAGKNKTKQLSSPEELSKPAEVKAEEQPFVDDINISEEEVNPNATAEGKKPDGDIGEHSGTDRVGEAAGSGGSDITEPSGEVKEAPKVEPRRIIDDILKDLDEVQGQQAEIEKAKDAGIAVSPEKEVAVEQKADDLKTELADAVREERSVEEQKPSNDTEATTEPKADNSQNVTPVTQNVTAGQSENVATLPPDISKSAPKYSYREKQFNIEFPDDVTKAAYIVRNSKKLSAKDAGFMSFLRSQYPEKTDEQIRALGESIKSDLTTQAKTAKHNTTLKVNSIIQEKENVDPAGQVEAAGEVKEREYTYKSPLRPIWMGFGKVIGQDYTQIDANTFTTKKPLSSAILEKLDLDALDKDHPANIKKRFNAFRSDMIDKLSEGATEIKLDDGTTLIYSDNMDVSTNRENPYRITRLLKDGTPAGHDIFKNFDEVAMYLWGDEKRIKSIRTSATQKSAPKKAEGKAQGGIRQGKIGDMLSSGEVALTSSGRETTPFPKITTGTDRKASVTLKRIDSWLRENAIAEAKARGDEWNARQFEASNIKNLSSADKYGMELYLFGEQPKVVPSVLRPLAFESHAPATKPSEPATIPDVTTPKGTADIPAKTTPQAEAGNLNFVKSIGHIETGDSFTAKLYHGSPDARFSEEFDPNRKGYYPGDRNALPDNKSWIELYGKTGGGFNKKSITGNIGVSFTDNYGTAKSYADKPVFDYQNSVPMVLERYVTLNNPKVFDLKGSEWNLKLGEEIEKAISEGHDGIVFKNIKDNYHPSDSKKATNNIIVFNTEQISRELPNPSRPPKGTANIPAKDKPQAEAGFTKVFRGEYQGNKKGNYYSPDVEFARQFTQSGLDKEIIEGFIKNKDIYRPKEDVYAGDPDAIEGIVQEAKNNGFKAVELSEGDGQPKSIYVIDRSAVKSTKQYTDKGTDDIPAKTTPQAEAGNPFKHSVIQEHVYHGTNVELSEFSDTHRGNIFLGNKAAEQAHWFTSNEVDAEHYAESARLRKGGRKNVIKTYLDIRNPRYATGDELYAYREELKQTTSNKLDEISDEINSLEFYPERIDPLIKKHKIDIQTPLNKEGEWEAYVNGNDTGYLYASKEDAKISALTNYLEAEKRKIQDKITRLEFPEELQEHIGDFIEEAKERGYDGIIITGEKGDPINYGVFSSKQVKLLPNPSRPPEVGGQSVKSPISETKPPLPKPPEAVEAAGEVKPEVEEDTTFKRDTDLYTLDALQARLKSINIQLDKENSSATRGNRPSDYDKKNTRIAKLNERRYIISQRIRDVKEGKLVAPEPKQVRPVKPTPQERHDALVGKDQEYYNSSPSKDFIESNFAFENLANKTSLARYLDGTAKEYSGLVGWKWQAALDKMGMPETLKTKETTRKEIAAFIKEKYLPAQPATKVIPTTKTAEKNVTTPKEQKKYLLEKIDEALKDAPDVPVDRPYRNTRYAKAEDYDRWAKEDRQLFNEYKEKLGTVVIEVPNDGTFTILNTKTSLENFKKQTSKFPASVIKGVPELKTPMPSKRETGKRLELEGVSYYNDFKPRKQDIIPSDNDAHNYYADGYYTQGHYLVKSERPKGIKISEETKDVKRVIPSDKDLIAADIVAEYNYGGGERETTKVHIITKDGKERAANAHYVDVILTKHPNATVFVKKDTAISPIVFKDVKEVVGVTMPLKDEIPSAEFIAEHQVDTEQVTPKNEELFGEKLASSPKPLRMDGTTRPERKKPEPLPGFDSLPQATKDKFNAAFESKNIPKMQEYLDLANKNLRAEFENRTGVKLPATVKGTDKAVRDYFSEQKEQNKKKLVIDDLEKRNLLARMLAKYQGRVNTVEVKGGPESLTEFERLIANGEIYESDIPEEVLIDFKSQLETPLPRTWFELGRVANQEYSNADVTASSTSLKPKPEYIKKVSDKLGITEDDVKTALYVFNSVDPRAEEKTITKPFPKIGVTEPKQPWEMTLDELASQKTNWYAGKQYLIPRDKFIEFGIARNYEKRDDGYYGFNYDNNKEYRVDEKILNNMREESAKSHKYYVQKARKEGKEIPEAVLKDYPELKKEANKNSKNKGTALYYPGGLGEEESTFKLEEAEGNVPTTQTSKIINDKGRVAEVAATISKTIGREIAPENLRLYERNKLDDLGKLGRAFQKTIVVFQAEGEDLSDLPAFFDPSSPRTIYLNAETGDPHLIILGHELLHALRHDAPDIYDGFISHIEATDFYIERKAQYEKVYGRKLTTDETTEEYVADFVGLQFAKQEFWDDLASRKPGIFKKIHDSFIRLLNKIKGIVLKTNKFFKDIKKAERSAAKSMADYAERQKHEISMSNRGDIHGENRSDVHTSKTPENIPDRRFTDLHDKKPDVLPSGFTKRSSINISGTKTEGVGKLGAIPISEEAKKRIDRNLKILGMEAQKSGTSLVDYMRGIGVSEGQISRLMEYAKSQPVEAPEGYREVLPDEVLPAGSDVNMDFISGKSFVKVKDTTGVKHAAIEEERVKAGKEPVIKQEPRGNEGMFQAAKAAVDSGEIKPRLLAQEVAKKPRPITTEEEFALMYDRMRIKNELRDIQRQIDTAQQDKNSQMEADLLERRTAIESDLDTNDQATTHGGSEVGRSLQARTRMINEDYSLEEILLRARQDNGGTLSEEMRKKYEALAREIEEANEKIKAYEEKIASLEAKRSFQRMKNDDVIIRHLGQAKEKRASAKKALDDEFSQLTKQLNAALGGIHMNFDPTAVKILALMAKNRIKAGILTPDGIVNEIYEQVHESYPEVEKRDIRDAISGYGRTLQLSKDEIDVQLREAKRLMRLISSYEDASSGQVPLRSGMQRDKMTNEVRELGRRVRQAMREAGIDWESSLSPEEQWKTSLDAVKTRLRNQIHDLTKQIETGEKTPKRIGIKYDEEAEALREQRDKLKETLISIEGKPEISPEQKIKMAMSAVEKSIAEYERRISEKDLAPKKQGTGSPETPELKSLRDRRDGLRAIYKEMQKEAKPKKSPEEIALKSYKTRMTNRIKELEEKLEKRDFTEKPKKQKQLDAEGLTLKHNLDRAIYRYKEARLKDQLARRSWLQKFGGGIAETANFMRSVKASMDVSAVFRQGLFTVVGHPVVGAKALPAMFKAFKNDKYRFEVEQDILNRPNYKLYQDAGLDLTDIGTDLSKMEETFMSRLAEKVPGVSGSQRAYTTFLNKIRVDTFDLLIKNLVKSEGKHTPEEAKAIATLINESTGRGKVGMKPNTLSGLNTIFFAPRLVASRFQILAGHSMWKGTKASRKLIAKEYGRFLAGMSVVYLLAQLAGFDIEWDTRSSDFGKIKIGNTRIDPMGGFAQVIVFSSRVISGKTKSSSGVIKPIRGDVQYGQGNTADVIWRFLRTKLAPAVSVSIDALTGTDIVGNKVTVFNPNELKAPETVTDIPKQIGKVSSLPEKTVAPMAIVDTYEAMRDRGIPQGLAIGALGMLGVGIQTYEKDTKQKLKDDLRDAIKSEDQEAIDTAKEAISDASDNELITERDKKRILKDAKDDAFVSAAKKMPLPALAEMIKEDATDDQKEALHDIFKKKIDRARQERRIDSETQDRYYEILEEMR